MDWSCYSDEDEANCGGYFSTYSSYSFNSICGGLGGSTQPGGYTWVENTGNDERAWVSVNTWNPVACNGKDADNNNLACYMQGGGNVIQSLNSSSVYCKYGDYKVGKYCSQSVCSDSSGTNISSGGNCSAISHICKNS